MNASCCTTLLRNRSKRSWIEKGKSATPTTSSSSSSSEQLPVLKPFVADLSSEKIASSAGKVAVVFPETDNDIYDYHSRVLVWVFVTRLGALIFVIQTWLLELKAKTLYIKWNLLSVILKKNI